MKNKINVIDLDKTLIPYDSFRLLIKNEIIKFNLTVFLYTILRVIRVISLEKFKKKIIAHLDKKHSTLFFNDFAVKIFNDIDLKVLKIIQMNTDEQTYNILISASPNLYVEKLIEKLEWIGSGSYIDKSGKFIHLHGKGKINWLDDNYINKKYMYNFAISDSSTDDQLLSIFKRKLKWTLQ